MQILDTAEEAHLDLITKTAARLFRVPIVLITLVDALCLIDRRPRTLDPDEVRLLERFRDIVQDWPSQGAGPVVADGIRFTAVSRVAREPPRPLRVALAKWETDEGERVAAVVDDASVPVTPAKT